jgi:hypothetical protein
MKNSPRFATQRTPTHHTTRIVQSSVYYCPTPPPVLQRLQVLQAPASVQYSDLNPLECLFNLVLAKGSQRVARKASFICCCLLGLLGTIISTKFCCLLNLLLLNPSGMPQDFPHSCTKSLPLDLVRPLYIGRTWSKS